MTIINTFARYLLPERFFRYLYSSDIARRLARGSLWSLFGSTISRLLILLTMILLARTLGRGEFGEFGIVQATLGVAGLMAGVGLGSTATRFVAQYARTSAVRAGHVIALVVSSSLVMVLLACALLAALSGPIAEWVLEASHLQGALLWGLVLMAVTAFRGVQNGVLAGLERFDVIARLNIIEGVVSLVGALLLARTIGVTGALLGLAVGAGASLIIGRVLLGRELRSRTIPVSYRGCLAEWPILTGYSLPNLLANLVATPVLWLAMTLVARSDQGYSGLGLYNAAYQWHGPIMFLPLILMSVSMPVLVQEWEAGRRSRFRHVTLGICGLMLALSLPLVIGLSALSPWVMSFYGPEFREGWLLLILLVGAAPLHGIAKVASAALFGMNRAWWVLGANIGWGVTLFSLTLWLLPGFGATALAVAFLGAYAVLAALSLGLALVGSRSLPTAAPSHRPSPEGVPGHEFCKT